MGFFSIKLIFKYLTYKENDWTFWFVFLNCVKDHYITFSKRMFSHKSNFIVKFILGKMTSFLFASYYLVILPLAFSAIWRLPLHDSDINIFFSSQFSDMSVQNKRLNEENMQCCKLWSSREIKKNMNEYGKHSLTW